jgi:glycosyltransferase involved in cell wall biosynthesis
LAHRGAEAALDRADLILVMTAADREALERAKPAAQRLVDLPPFLDLDEWALAPAVGGVQGGPGSRPHPDAPPASMGAPVRLLTVAMMRGGDKLASYTLLSEALDSLQDRPWTLDVVGDGEAREAVSALLARFAPRVRFHGSIDERDRLQELYRVADLFVWPAVNEAYGMAPLEAQALGCPVVAGAYGGVSSVVQDGVTGLLTRPGDTGHFAEAVAALVDDAPRRRELGAAARRFVVAHRSLPGTARRLGAALEQILPSERAP